MTMRHLAAILAADMVGLFTADGISNLANDRL
jgi:hypothetical protein